MVLHNVESLAQQIEELLYVTPNVYDRRGLAAIHHYLSGFSERLDEGLDHAAEEFLGADLLDDGL